MKLKIQDDGKKKGKRTRVEVTYQSRSGEPIVLVKSSYEPAIGEFEPKEPYRGQLTGIVHNMQYYYDFHKNVVLHLKWRIIILVEE